MGRDILRQLADKDVLALQCSAEEWPRSLLSARSVPAGWTGLRLRGDGRRDVIASGEEPDLERGCSLLLLRERDVQAPIELDNCTAAKGNRVAARCVLRLQWRRDADDLAAMHRTLMDEPVLTHERLVRRVADGGATAALRQFIRERPAAELVGVDQRDALADALNGKMKRFFFDAGLELERVAQLEFTSDTYARQQDLEREAAERVERIQARQMVEKAAFAATQRRLDDLSGLLGKLRAAAADDPSMQWHELLPALTPAERGRLLENLWRITPDRRRAEAIVIVAGQECLWLDPAEPETIRRRVRLDESLGGLRSVTFAPSRRTVLVGAARGIWMLDATDGSVSGKYAAPAGGAVRTGFNAACIAGERLIATHSQLGCWAWPLDNAAAATPLLQPEAGAPRTVRCATAMPDGGVLFVADDQIHVHGANLEHVRTLSTGDRAITGAALLDTLLFVGVENGMVIRADLNEADPALEVVHRASGPIESIQARRWNDLVELVIPAGHQGVCGVYGGEGVVTRLLDGGASIRRAWATDDVIAGLTERRDVLIVMNANLPQRSGREVHIGRMTGHSIQDACIVVEGGSAVPGLSDGGVATRGKEPRGEVDEVEAT
jgi:hypothetical protein